MTPIDLSTLEQGDTILYGKSKSKCTVNKIKKIDAFKFLVSLYKQQTGTLITHHFDKNGVNQSGVVDIVMIIKNPRRWTDEDMKAAFFGGYEYAIGATLNSHAWLEQYKESKNETG